MNVDNCIIITMPLYGWQPGKEQWNRFHVTVISCGSYLSYWRLAPLPALPGSRTTTAWSLEQREQRTRELDPGWNETSSRCDQRWPLHDNRLDTGWALSRGLAQAGNWEARIWWAVLLSYITRGLSLGEHQLSNTDRTKMKVNQQPPMFKPRISWHSFIQQTITGNFRRKNL